MTSSFILGNLLENVNQWSYQLPGATLGGLEDSYLKINGNCHPDFITVPIGHPAGTKMCVRKTDAQGRRIGDALHQQSKELIARSNGYWRGSVRMYDVAADTPIQYQNPDAYCNRRMPYDADLVRADLPRQGMAYSGTGIKTLRVPHELKDANKPYFSYSQSFTPIEDPETGKRVATRMSQAVPPVKWDLNRLHQIYPVWKREGEYLGVDRNGYDATNTWRIV